MVRSPLTSPYWSDGTQTHHWVLAGLTAAQLDAIEQRLAAQAPARLADAACIHDPAGYRAYHRLRAFRRARGRMKKEAGP